VSGIIPPAGPPGGHTRTFSSEVTMSWKKPEFEVVAVTMEVTAYVATL
jgi:coenzyme PQQ precursor peptide PqqA